MGWWPVEKGACRGSDAGPGIGERAVVMTYASQRVLGGPTPPALWLRKESQKYSVLYTVRMVGGAGLGESWVGRGRLVDQGGRGSYGGTARLAREREEGWPGRPCIV